ncbi:NUDIX hydrolase [Micromonospora krabiensis]|uniref:ADP-ribose pyrophosphatase YjhB, NUDIX family n=1 Tax=Micromonospora krabiensis TaxID=307121 RepID=A0A1C3NDG6_9ACTN|nr:NUDIX domain-containing protein [Micromonospora krabiensis]SBV30591.1 ADP-ribose pyrophosphatase YjhB, NUDIX family [Micromonospora krabiensis]
MSTLTWAVAAVVSDEAGRVLLCRHGRGERRYALPGGRLRRPESPVDAAVRDIRAETGHEIEVVDLVGLYHLAEGLPCAPSAPPGRAAPLPDVLVHVFRARLRGDRPVGDAADGCRLSWHDPADLPAAVTPTTRAAIGDATAGRSGVLRDCPSNPRPPEQRADPTPQEPAHH